MPPALTFTRNWPACRAGVSTGSTRRSPGAWMTRASMVPSSERCGDAAIHVQDVAVDEIGSRAREEDRRAGEVLHVAPAPAGRAIDQPLRELRVVDQRLRQLGLEVAGAQAIDLDAV